MTAMITNQDRAAIRRIFDKTHAGIEPLVRARARELGLAFDPTLHNIMAAQNAIRCCMEVVYNQCLPYDTRFLAEMAVRLAAYSISAAPIDRQEGMVVAVQAAIPQCLTAKLQQGAIINTTWVTDGIEHPNVPAKGDVQ